ncbi:MAG: TonB-dependent receptor [Bacteroidetes bacterium]|nr:TonB-dependent receptor [Bacteroidota bacterium]MBK8144995.1 TonB-dependent receptor [Bacteroidota bacterium]MBP6314977.1 TonB-dependent receptor [Chitinophagaceae bacterium]
MKPFYILFFLCFSIKLQAQQATFTGTVKNATSKEIIDFATVSLKKTIDTSIVFGSTTKLDGTFEIKNIPYGTYHLMVSSVGFESKIIKNVPIQEGMIAFGNVALVPNSKALKNVTVKGEKADIEIGIDKKTFNVDKNITTAGGTAVDVLRNIPSVNVDMDGNPSLRGKENVTLLVDGKPSAMFGNDAATALATIPAASIESIEVITNPSSKYEAQGMNGIINILMKKDRKAGFNGLINAGIAEPFRLNGGVNLNYKKGNWNVFLNANARTSKTWEKTQTARDNYENNITYSSNAFNRRRPLSGFANFGAEYNLHEKNKITLTQSIFNANMRGEVNTTIRNEYDYDQNISTQQRQNTYTGMPLSGTTNLQFKHIFKNPKEDINIELNYSKSRYKRTSNFSTLQYDSLDNLTGGFTQKNPVLGGNQNGTIQIDYTKPIGKNSRIELGERSYVMQFKSENDPTIQFLNQSEIPEILLKNHFLFSQNVHGIYANYGTQLKNTGVQVGLRGEYFSYGGTVYQYNTKVANSYLGLFPTLFVSQKITPKSDVNFNYARRVNRPNFYQLIPFIDVSNPQDTSMGNPGLRPEFIHATEFSYTNQYDKSSTFIGSVYYQYTSNLIQRFRRFNDNGTTFSQNRNLATGITYGMELTNKMNLLSWWDATLNINIFRNKINGSNIDPSTARSGYGGFAKFTSNAKFAHGVSAQLTANYFAATVVAQGQVKPYSNIDLALKKTFLHNLITLTINANDIFNTIQTNTVYNLYPYYRQSVLRKNQTRSIGLNLQIKFADRKQMKNAEQLRKPIQNKKTKETKNRDENLKKDEGGDDNGGGGNRDNNSK